MKITIQNQEFINRDIKTPSFGNSKVENRPHEKVGAGAIFDGSVQRVSNNNLFDNGDNKMGKGKSLTDLRQEMESMDVGISQDYQTVLSNTMSKEDYAKAQEEGFDYNDMDYRDVVTIQDKIKAEVAKSGEVIVGYNDDLSSDKLAKILGNENLARDIEKSFSEANIPITEDNASELAKAWEYASTLEKPTDEAISYMVQNEMEPTIWNFYLAENSGVDAVKNIANQGTTIRLADEANSKLLDQVTNMLVNAGYIEDASSDKDINIAISEAQWLLDRELPVTVDNIQSYEEINSVSFPVLPETFADVAAASVSRGISPVYADLTEDESIYSLASKAKDKYFSEELWEQTVGDITARRQLEEIRLVMTAEVNLKLLESDLSFDTTPMEELINALKEAEKQVATKYFPDYADNAEAAVKNYRLMNETNEIISDLEEVPAANLGMFMTRDSEDISIREFHSSGVILKDTYEKAGETYEALMTAPRSDLGDSISKAFSNVEDLANELGIEPTQENQRAIRILGYNHMEVTQDNVDRIVVADTRVQSIVNKMTPASVLEMIRDGINPLEKSFDELTAYFESKHSENYEREAKHYSEFLYGLEMQNGISDEERESFIGIYRLLHQIETLDSAAVGSVINMEAELDFKNLLAAVRIRKLHGIDVTMDKNYGSASEIIKDSLTITEQIASAFKNERYEEEAEALRDAANVSKQAAMMAEKYGIAESANNYIALEELISKDGNLFDELTKYDKGKEKLKDISAKAENALSSDDFDEEYKEIENKLGSLSEELSLEAEKYVDVKALSLIHKQISIAKSIADKQDLASGQEYIIPMEIGDKMSKVHLSFINGQGEASVAINVTMGDGEGFEAYFEVKESGLEGYLVGNNDNELKKMEMISDIFGVALSENEQLKQLAPGRISVIGREFDRQRAIKSDKENNQGKDATVIESDGSERKVLLQVTKVFLQSVRRA